MKYLVVSVGKHNHLFRPKREFREPVRPPEEPAYCIVNDLKGQAAFLVATWNEFPVGREKLMLNQVFSISLRGIKLQEWEFPFHM